MRTLEHILRGDAESHANALPNDFRIVLICLLPKRALPFMTAFAVRKLSRRCNERTTIDLEGVPGIGQPAYMIPV